ncbi:protein deglycase HchA [Enterovibrio norvegicus]|uniref:glyoxalase III HchA n=1 Tax=Enterovibrio norvegicus TaxID=188144 RepID=UPI000C859CB5|nr:glyoxalase III HchA [Enterovibrio norvegicus]MCC4796682.1 protein deglycase HchA [Enterovibrio norvegicus]PMI35803.1 protein deglycase HchA [Enterovibrio norvegicus]PMN56833.1 protein deglycase HchA [Enterovibrio norvegicus]TKF13033.1 protein deglycase HchA [Enterovibrio norvegicus]TKF31660.1 protein deglycase HchA [Enterovibrio norvegicus]
MLKKLFGLAPKRESDGSYSPSKLALKLATSDKTDYESVTYRQYEGNRSKVLVIFTEQKNMEMQNGKQFSTGNHPVEALLPMLHLKNAGFDFDIVTPTGKPVIFEMWAFPNKDDKVIAFFNEYKSRFEQPGSLGDFVNTSLSESDAYAAVFIPGGHGAMLGIPEDINVGKALHWANDNGLFTITLCHGPGALLATSLEGNEFLCAGYKMAVFPDSVDDVTPKVGYLPGKMPWGLSKKLESLGVTLMNTKSDKTVCLDRQLITGASPMAADALGKLAANALLDSLK